MWTKIVLFGPGKSGIKYRPGTPICCVYGRLPEVLTGRGFIYIIGRITDRAGPRPFKDEGASGAASTSTTGAMARYLVYITAFVMTLALSSTAGAFVVEVDDLRGPGAGASQGPCGDSVIVIDPGHGGEDTGAIGPGGALEKDLTLTLAEKLAVLLREEGGCQVFLTRTADVYVPLEERTLFANSHGADIFISIHANATPSSKVRGIETYFLSFEASDDDARRVAAFENNIPGVSPAALTDPQGGQTDIKDILIDLARTEAHHESSALAESVHTALVEATGKGNRGVKQAPFVVLTGAVMPAVLVEVGFISNPAEARWLLDGAEQNRIAESITSGVLGFTTVFGGSRDYVGLNEGYLQ